MTKSDEKLSKKLQRWLKVCNSGTKWEKVVKWANRNWTRFYKELLSQSFEVLQMWPRHTQPPVSEIAIVFMVSMLFPWHFSGIIWHGIMDYWHGMAWNAMEFHGIQKIVIVSISRAVQIVIKAWNFCIDIFLLLESYKKWRHVIWLL